MDSYSLIPFPQDDDFVFIDKDFYPAPESPNANIDRIVSHLNENNNSNDGFPSVEDIGL